MTKKETAFLSNTFLFRGMDEAEAATLLSDLPAKSILCQRGEAVEIEHAVAFIYSGECEIIRRGERERLILNVLKKSDSFGILSVFCNESVPTSILAKKETQILYLTRETLIALTERSHAVAMNIIRFLSDRVCFLNRKIATLGSATVEEKCISFLAEEIEKNGSRFPFQAAKAARKIGAGRASLYRALNTLVNNGVLLHEDGAIQILKPDYFVIKQKEIKK